MTTTPPSPASRGRLIAARILVVLGLVLGLLSMLGGYVRWQAFDSDTFKETATELIADETIRAEIAATLADQLWANVDVAAEIESRLPEEQQGLAAPIAGALRQLADRAAFELLERPRVQDLFVDAAVASQGTAVRALRDELRVGETVDGYFVVDLRDVVVQLGNQLEILGNIGERLPEDVGQIRVAQVDRFEKVQDATTFFESTAVVLPWLVLALLVSGVWLARGRRRRELKVIGFGVIATGLLVIVLRRISGRILVDELSPVSSVEPAVQRAWDIITQLLLEGALTAVIVGVAILLGLWLSGQGRVGRRVRFSLAPVLARRGLGYTLFAVILGLLVWWGPTAQLERPRTILVFAVLLGIAYEALRAVVVREEPGAASVDPIERLREGVSGGSAPPPPPAPSSAG
jgi:multisubunit Na+/H+ antiporter MnhC subunit